MMHLPPPALLGYQENLQFHLEKLMNRRRHQHHGRLPEIGDEPSAADALVC
uniref:Uncharacterized protein n=1 Tax=Hyaloperonospora arabidopsidis (strain Emoy2) TaxID=559515 RepID=M4BVZ0_HYAAE